MKTRVTYKNGFPKAKGIVLIIAAISVLCFINCLASSTIQPEGETNNHETTPTYEVLSYAEADQGTEY